MTSYEPGKLSQGRKQHGCSKTKRLPYKSGPGQLRPSRDSTRWRHWRNASNRHIWAGLSRWGAKGKRSSVPPIYPQTHTLWPTESTPDSQTGDSSTNGPSHPERKQVYRKWREEQRKPAVYTWTRVPSTRPQPLCFVLSCFQTTECA